MKYTFFRAFAALLLVLSLSFLLLVGCDITKDSGTTTTLPNPTSGRLIKVHMIDCGQADSILIQTEDGNMLIDAGDTSGQTKVTNYLKNMGVTELEWLVLTHPHADHIGAASAILSQIDVKRVMLPDAAYDSYIYSRLLSTLLTVDAEIHIVEVYEGLVTGLDDVTAKIYYAGESFSMGELNFKILSPITGDGNINNYSITLRMVYGNNSFLFTGDMEGVAENKLLNKFSKEEIQSDVLKVGHHGSYTSTTDRFLDAVNPKYALISCGKNNDYGHPHTSTINHLTNRNINTYRTDLDGTIIVYSNGQDINVMTTK